MEQSTYMLPIVSEDAFRFPTQEFWDELYKDGPGLLRRAGLDVEIEYVVDVIKGIFSEIAIAFHACDISALDLQTRGNTCARRIYNRKKVKSGAAKDTMKTASMKTSSMKSSSLKSKEEEEAAPSMEVAAPPRVVVEVAAAGNCSDEDPQQEVDIFEDDEF